MTGRTPDPANPTDPSLLGLVDRLADEGWTGQFRAVDGADVECLTCHRGTPAASVRADDMRRLEGASDPADMVMVVPLRCPHCHTRGTLTLAYGPDASAEEADVLAALGRRATASAPGLRPDPPG